ncbi:hypothetical protein [Streptomyces murinus]|uniref:hypothetical protein n=1 Tax=Streptomyces murinus TaxID=33900 RepID=UPI001601CA16|nr:hypothetical protein [Streptomyces murinus]
MTVYVTAEEARVQGIEEVVAQRDQVGRPRERWRLRAFWWSCREQQFPPALRHGAGPLDTLVLHRSEVLRTVAEEVGGEAGLQRA